MNAGTLPVAPTARPSMLVSCSRALWVVLPVLALALFARTATVMNHDVAWLTVAADRMLAGGRFFFDYLEINMPLAIAVYLPARLISRVTAWSPGLGVDVWTMALIAQTLLLLARVADLQRGTVPVALRLFGLAWIGVGLGLLPGYHFAQREHLMMILLLPWLMSLTGDARCLGLALRSYLVVLAALGCFIKPQFAALPLVLLLPRCFVTRSLAPVLAPDALLLVAIGLLNTAVVNLAFPEWWTCAQWARDLYATYQRSSAGSVLLQSPMPLVALACLPPLVLVVRDRRLLPSALPLLLVAGYGFCAYVLQFKGWSYQLLPVTIAVFLLGGWGLCAAWTSPAARTRGPVLIAVVGGILALGLVGLSLWDLPRRTALDESELVQALAPASPGDVVYVFSTAMIPAFPIVVEKGLAWGSRMPALGPLAGIVAKPFAGRPGAAQLQASYSNGLREMLYQDFVRYQPRLVLVDRRDGQFGLPAGFRILDFFTADPRFLSLWKQYKQIGASRSYEIYLR